MILNRPRSLIVGQILELRAVALDDNGKPTPVPTLRIDNDEDQKRFDEGKLRMERRLKERQN